MAIRRSAHDLSLTAYSLLRFTSRRLILSFRYHGHNGTSERCNARLAHTTLLRQAERGEVGFFTSYNRDGRFISYYGDNHPQYAGNVVKAMASAKDGYPHVVELFRKELAAVDESRQQERDAEWDSFREMLDDRLLATVHEVIRLTPTIVEVIVRAPFAAERFHPGQFYRLQNYETLAPRIDGTPLLMEGIALTGAWVDREQGLMSTIVLEMGTSSRLCAALRRANGSC